MDKPAVAVITAVKDARHTVGDCMKSVQSQTCRNIEHILVDGVSTDGTLDIIREMRTSSTILISERDAGIYDAINKGIRTASAEIVGILHADDVYDNEFVIETVLNCFEMDGCQSCYGDLVYVSRADRHKVIRYWRAGAFKRERFEKGWMPPHPTFFAKKQVYERYGYLDGTRFPLAADYEMMLRFLYRYSVSTSYIPQVLVRMSTGGTSNPGLYTAKAIIENYRSWKVNGLSANPITFMLKPLSKLLQFLSH
jgi:glycosyltransferase involved in cell wall biosynthesis